jgi:hypothetical protein
MAIAMMMKLRDFQDAFRFVDWSEQNMITQGSFSTVCSGVYPPLEGPSPEQVCHHFT